MLARIGLCLVSLLTFNAARADSDGSDGPTPWSHFVEGHCWLDDDPQFDANQIDGGILYGRTSLSLREECAYAARMRFGDLGSSFVGDVKPVSGQGNAVQAECWIDDDTQFDFGQTSGGTLVGQSTFDLREECALIARERFGPVSSSSLANAKLVTLGSQGLLQGRCWLDDDTQFDMNQVDGGPLFGYSSRALREECAYAARLRFGALGSSAVMDVKPAEDKGTVVRAECWIDDDAQFDFDQTFGGDLFGYDSFEIRRECAYIARERYGDLGSSGLRNVRLTP